MTSDGKPSIGMPLPVKQIWPHCDLRVWGQKVKGQDHSETDALFHQAYQSPVRSSGASSFFSECAVNRHSIGLIMSKYKLQSISPNVGSIKKSIWECLIKHMRMARFSFARPLVRDFYFVLTGVFIVLCFIAFLVLCFYWCAAMA